MGFDLSSKHKLVLQRRGTVSVVRRLRRPARDETASVHSPGGRKENSPGQAQRSPGWRSTKDHVSRRDAAKCSSNWFSCAINNLHAPLKSSFFLRRVWSCRKCQEGIWVLVPAENGCIHCGILKSIPPGLKLSVQYWRVRHD